MHPLVFFHEYRLTDAGEPGLSRDDAHRGARRHRKRAGRARAVREARRDGGNVPAVARDTAGQRLRARRGVEDVLLRGAHGVRAHRPARPVRAVGARLPPRAAAVLLQDRRQACRCWAHRGAGAPVLVLPVHEPSPRGAHRERLRQPRPRGLGEPVHRRGEHGELLGPVRPGAREGRGEHRRLRPRRLRPGGRARPDRRAGLLGPTRGGQRSCRWRGRRARRADGGSRCDDGERNGAPLARNAWPTLELPRPHAAPSAPCWKSSSPSRSGWSWPPR